MPDTEKLESLLVADVGSTNSHVALVDRVGDGFRFLGSGTSQSTLNAPYSDALLGVRRAIQQIEGWTGRRLLTDEGQLMFPERPSGQGVDGFAAVTSAPPPLRVAVVGLSREVSVASAVRAVQSTYATVVATLALDETGGRWMRGRLPVNGNSAAHHGDPAVTAAQAMANANPEVVVLVGGIDGGATTALYEIANLVAAIAASREEGVRPVVVFAGNRAERPQIAQRLGQVATFRVVDNVHPTLDREDIGALQRELEALYVEHKLSRMPGLNGFAKWTTTPVLPTAYAFENVTRYLSRRYGLAVLGADIGGTSTTVVTAHQETFSRVLRADLGLGRSLENLVNQTGLDALQAWMPFDITTEQLHAHILNRACHPTVLPTSLADARVMQAAARLALATTVRQARLDTRNYDLIVLTGGAMAHNSNYGTLALLALDALEPSGVFTLAVDNLGLAPAFGGLAPVNTQAAANVVERDGFMTLGTVIAPLSSNRDGQVDVRVQLQPAGSGPINLEVQHGSLEIVPLVAGQKAALEVRMSPGVDLGPARHGVFKAEVEGGAVGLIIDARGRPITFPSSVDKRREKIQQWIWDVGG